MVIAFNLNTISQKLLDNITMWHMFHSVMEKRNIFSYVFTNDCLQYLTYLCVFSINKISICVDSLYIDKVCISFIIGNNCTALLRQFGLLVKTRCEKWWEYILSQFSKTMFLLLHVIFYRIREHIIINYNMLKNKT